MHLNKDTSADAATSDDTGAHAKIHPATVQRPTKRLRWTPEEDATMAARGKKSMLSSPTGLEGRSKCITLRRSKSSVAKSDANRLTLIEHRGSQQGLCSTTSILEFTSLNSMSTIDHSAVNHHRSAFCHYASHLLSWFSWFVTRNKRKMPPKMETYNQGRLGVDR